MKDIIELLQNERTKTVDALKQGEQDKLSHLLRKTNVNWAAIS